MKHPVARLAVVAVVAAAVAGVMWARHEEASRAEPVTDPIAVPASLPKLLDLGADKCIPCKRMAPILVALREDFAGQFDVVFIDVWKDKQAARAHGVSLIPTQIFFDAKGNELFRHKGFFSREDILATWAELEYTFTAPASAPSSDGAETGAARG
jgi:thioredoxin 1